MLMSWQEWFELRIYNSYIDIEWWYEFFLLMQKDDIDVEWLMSVVCIYEMFLCNMYLQVEEKKISKLFRLGKTMSKFLQI